MKVKTNMLTDYLHGQAGWQEIMARETEDGRYASSAAALLAAAKFAEQLDDSDPRIQCMDRARCASWETRWRRSFVAGTFTLIRPGGVRMI